MCLTSKNGIADREPEMPVQGLKIKSKASMFSKGFTSDPSLIGQKKSWAFHSLVYASLFLRLIKNLVILLLYTGSICNSRRELRGIEFCVRKCLLFNN